MDGFCLCVCLFVCLLLFFVMIESSTHVLTVCSAASGSNMHHSSSSSSMTAEEATRGVAVEKLENMKKWSINTYKVSKKLILV